MIRRLRLRMVAVIMSIVTLLLCLMVFTVLQLTRSNLERESLVMMEGAAHEPFREERPDEDFTGIRLPYFMLRIGDDGQPQPIGGDYYTLTDEDFLQQITEQANASPEDFGVLAQYHLRFLRVDTEEGEVLVFADISHENSVLADLTRTCLLIAAAGFLVLLGFSILLAFWMVRPVDVAWKQQRQFVADASHELKTPLTVILTDAELLQDTDCDAREKEHLAESILTEARQMRTLIESLLELARTDQGIPKAQMRCVDWSETVTDAMLPFEPLYYERGLALHSDIEPGIRVTGDAARLREVVEILADNAQKYAAPQTDVKIGLRRQGSSCLLTVSSRGEEIPKNELDNIFKRFYRIDPARCRNGSYGLGLSIAKNIVTLHKGKIWAQSENGCNTFMVRLPMV